MQEVMGPLIRLIRPEVQDLWAYYEAGFHNLLVVGVHQRYGKEAIKTRPGDSGRRAAVPDQMPGRSWTRR